MPGIIFDHPRVGTLNLRLAPTSVEWTYNMNVRTYDTFAGQVVQVLSMNFGDFVIMGRFGREGPHGKNLDNNTITSRTAGELSDYKNAGIYAVGLTQMTEYFRSFFSIASQGHDSIHQGNYDQTPISLTYDGALDVPIDTGKPETWMVYPKSFPSYRRSNQDFAPEWRVECEVVEPDKDVVFAAKQESIENLRDTVNPSQALYRPFSPFSDPVGGLIADTLGSPSKFYELTRAKQVNALKAAQAQLGQENAFKSFQHFANMLPTYTDEDLEALLNMNGSFPVAQVPNG